MILQNVSLSWLSEQAQSTFETCQKAAISTFSSCQITVCDTAGKVQGGVSSFFQEASKFVQTHLQNAENELKNLVASYVIPAKAIPARRALTYHTWATSDEFTRLGQASIEAREVHFQTSDGIELNGVELKRHIEGGGENQKYILFFLPNGAIWETILPLLQTLHEQSGANVVCYNYRGIGQSGGTCNTPEPLIQDGVEIAEALLDRGIKPLIHGYSFGGGIATQVVHRMQNRGQVLDLCNERSFTSIPMVVEASYPLIGWMATPIILWTGWELNSEATLRYLLGRVIVITHPKDEVIPHPAQFSRAAERRQAENTLRGPTFHFLELSEEANRHTPHNREWFQPEKERYRQIVAEIL